MRISKPAPSSVGQVRSSRRSRLLQWAAPSEEFGRWKILQASLFLVNIWQVLVALAPNYASVVVGRILGGFSSAGGSVTLAIIADMFPQWNQQWAVNFIVFSSVGGSVVGPIAGAFIQVRLSIYVQSHG